MNDQQWVTKVRGEFEAAIGRNPSFDPAVYADSYKDAAWAGYLLAKQQDKAAMEFAARIAARPIAQGEITNRHPLIAAMMDAAETLEADGDEHGVAESILRPAIGKVLAALPPPVMEECRSRWKTYTAIILMENSEIWEVPAGGTDEKMAEQIVRMGIAQKFQSYGLPAPRIKSIKVVAALSAQGAK